MTAHNFSDGTPASSWLKRVDGIYLFESEDVDIVYIEGWGTSFIKDGKKQSFYLYKGDYLYNPLCKDDHSNYKTGM